MTLPPPSVLIGIPKLTGWFPGQQDLFSKCISWFHDTPRFIGVAAATGSGKTAISLLAARLSGARTIILTATKGLEQQYFEDAKFVNGVVVHGQNNFTCALVSSLRADEGPCHDGVPCSLKQSVCQYHIQLQKALQAKIVVTNYAYYLAQTNFSQGLGEVGLLILDEGHQAFGAMENFLTIHLSRLEVESMGISFPSSDKTDISQWSVWQSWAELSLPIANEVVATIDADIKEARTANGQVPGHVSRSFRSAKAVAARLERLSKVEKDWVIERATHGFRFTPKWVAQYSDSLFGKVPKVMLMSAILSRKTADSLGVPQAPDCDWVDAESYFPPENTPIWHIPTARINYRTDDFGSTVWVSRIDQIIQRRLDRKGIVFTVSYERARMLLQRSRFRDIMLTHSTNDVVYVVNKFKVMKAPAVLVSPSVTTGYDFPGGGKSQYIIVGKIPYPDTLNPVLKARHEDDKDWSSFLAMETLIQECGRMSRGMEDKTEVFIVDDAATWYLRLFSKFAPLWFRKRCRGSLATVPDPLFPVLTIGGDSVATPGSDEELLDEEL